MQTADSHLKADLLLLLVTLLAAAGWIFSKEALAELPPLLFIGTRFLMAGMLLALAGLQPIRAMTSGNLRQSLGLGLLFAIAMGFWIMGLHHGAHVGEGAFITSLGIVLVPVIARWVFKDRPPRSTWLALPVAVIGFGCLSLNHGFRVEPGQLFYLTSAVFFAVLFNINSRVVSRVPAIALTSIQLVVVGLGSLVASALVETWPGHISQPIIGWLVASALLATSLRFFIQVYAQGLTSPSHAAVIMMLEPIWTAVLAAYWFGESMSAVQFIGCALIFFALIINRWEWIRRLLKNTWA